MRARIVFSSIQVGRPNKKNAHNSASKRQYAPYSTTSLAYKLIVHTAERPSSAFQNTKYAKSICLCLFVAIDDAIRKHGGEEIIIPFGVGIAGAVAETKDTINIKDAYDDPRFNSEIDMRTGYKTSAILSMPICNYEGDVIGVAQIINKTNGK